MSDSRLISVLLPVHNEAGRLRRTIDSVMRQTYEQVELVIINDGSTDGTLKEIDAGRPYPRPVRVLEQARTGISGALNHGLAEAAGSCMARIDAGDRAAHDWLALHMAAMNGPARPDVVFGRVILVNERDEPFYVLPLICPRDTRSAVLRGRSFPHPFVLCRKAAVQAAGGYPRQDGIEDYLLWRQMASRGCTMAVNRRLVGIQTRTAAHNDLIERRLGLRHAGLPANRLERALLHAYTERAFIYKTRFSAEHRLRRQALGKRHPITSVRAAARALAMLVAARSVLLWRRRRINQLLQV